VSSTRVANGPWKTRIEQGTVPYSRPTIETCYLLGCNSVTNINKQRKSKSYNVDHNLKALKRNHNLFIHEKPLATIRFTTVKYYTIMDLQYYLLKMLWYLPENQILTEAKPRSISDFLVNNTAYSTGNRSITVLLYNKINVLVNQWFPSSKSWKLFSVCDFNKSAKIEI
jgi:hypothetical protein